MNMNRTRNYLDLLAVRQKWERRNLAILGGMFIIAFIALVAFGMLDKVTGRSLYLSASVLVVLSAGFLRAWIKFMITNQTIELLDNLSG